MNKKIKFETTRFKIERCITQPAFTSYSFGVKIVAFEGSFSAGDGPLLQRNELAFLQKHACHGYLSLQTVSFEDF